MFGKDSKNNFNYPNNNEDKIFKWLKTTNSLNQKKKSKLKRKLKVIILNDNKPLSEGRNRLNICTNAEKKLCTE